MTLEHHTAEQWGIRANKVKLALLKEKDYFNKEKLLTEYTFYITQQVKAENKLIPTE